MVRLPARILRVHDETSIDRSIRLGLDAAAAPDLRFEPGQHVWVHDAAAPPPSGGAYSISSSPSELPEVEVTVRGAGDFGAHLYALPVGATVEVSRPLGRFRIRAEPGRNVVLFANGSGISPYRSFVRQADERGRTDPVVLVHSVQVEEHLIYRDEMERLQRRHAWFTYAPTVTRAPHGAPWTGRRGRIDATLLQALARDPERTLVYACGSADFVDLALDLARRREIPEANLHRERWD